MEPPKDAFVRRCELVRFKDGDTCILKIDLGFGASMMQTVRLAGVDTPESRGAESAAGRWVADRVNEYIGDNKEVWIHSREYTVDKYQRCVADVWIAGASLNQWLLQKGYGWPADEKGNLVGPRSIESLSIPDGIKQQVREAMA